MKNKANTWLFLLSFFIFCKSLHTEQNNHKAKKIMVIDEKFEIENYKCIHLFGSSLDECMLELEEKEYLDNFKHLKTIQRKKHLDRTINSIEDYAKFCRRCIKQESDWQEIWEHLTPEEQTFFPKTSTEQYGSFLKLVNEYKAECNDIEVKSGAKRIGIAMAATLALDLLAPGASLPARVLFAWWAGDQVDDEDKQKAEYFMRKKKESHAFTTKEY